jgi:hypothetical protein
MASKYQLITGLYESAIKEVLNSPAAWTAFLRSACRNYKCRFDEQILIYAQRPDATAVLEIEKWNKQFGRWVNRGVKGIAVFDDKHNGNYRLKHYFDIADTHTGRFERPVPLWQMKPEYEAEVVESLENSFGDLDDKSSLANALIAAANNAVEDNMADYLRDMFDSYEDSLTGEPANANLGMEYCLILQKSVAYMLLTRCGIDADKYFALEDFQYIGGFNIPNADNSLGIATSDISEMCLREIAATVQNLQQENRTFAAPDDLVYDLDNRLNEERSSENHDRGINIPDGGRLPDTEPIPTGGSTGSPWQVRIAPQEIPATTPPRSIPESADDRDAQPTPDGDRRERQREDGSGYPADGGSPGRDRADESRESNAVGGDDEQYPAQRGGSYTPGSDIRLKPLPTISKQLSLFEEAEEPADTESSAFSISQPINDEALSGEPEPYTPKQGDRYEIQGRLFTVDKVDLDWGEVKLRDVTFEGNTGFPIFRSEKLDFIRMHDPIQPDPGHDEPIMQQDEPILTPAWEKPKPRSRTQAFDLYPEIPISERHNYRITNADLGVGGQKTKYKCNIEAIRALQNIDRENRFATPEEQEILARYVGWGGLAQAFDPDNPQWTNEYNELSALLTPEEYAGARASTLNAHYTSPTVIRAIYRAVENMGFRIGNILEPSCGTGNFFGLLPESMSESKSFGVELDSVTGRIARQLYQKNNIAVQGFEATELPDSFFDLAIGNVPFGEYKIPDKRYDKHNFLIHDYFFARTLDKVRPGGVIAFVSSKGTLDKQNSTVRKYIAQRADLLGAIRLPNNAFSKNAGTQVTTDIIFLQKRDRIIDIEPDWLHLGETENAVPVNSYFIEHPDMILGEMVFDKSMYGNKTETACHPFLDSDLAEQLAEAITNIHAEITDYERGEDEPEEDNSIPADPSVRNFSYTLVNNQIYYRQDSRMIAVELPVTAQNRVKGLIELRECVRTLIIYQTEDYPDIDIQAEQAKLNRLYDSYTKKYGMINSRGNSLAFAQDSAYCLLCSLEVIDENGDLERKADIFTKRTIRPHIPVEHVDTASEALALSISEKARVDLSYMSELTGMSEDTLVKELDGVIFLNIGNTNDTNNNYVTAEEYLSGNIREKLVLAQAAQATFPDGRYDTNVRALEAALPPDLTAAEISVRLGATWLPEDVIQSFVYELLHPSYYAREKIKVHYSFHTGEWNITEKSADRSNVHSYNTYGTRRVSAYKIIEDSLNLRDVRIFDKVNNPDGSEKRILNKKETAIAQAKQELVRSKFEEWIWHDPDRRERLCRIYNDKFNSLRPREYDGSHIKFIGMNPEIALRKHQIDAIARILYGRNTMLAHAVGAGYEQSDIMRSRRQNASIKWHSAAFYST